MRSLAWGRMALAAVLLALSALPGSAQDAGRPDPCKPAGIRTDVRPGPKAEPTVISIGIRMMDLREIDDVNQTITVDAAVRMNWTDERLADYAGCRISLDRIWFPDLVLSNSGRVFSRWPESVSVGDGGRVTYMQRVSGTFSSYHTLEDFPFDTQSIDLTVFPLNWSEPKVRFQHDDIFEGTTDRLNISDWQLLGVASKVAPFDVQALNADRSSYVFTINTKRYVNYYVWKIIIPICLIVIMSWSVFWIDARQFGTQLGLSATSVLTMVAFIFATTNMLPRLGYFTLLDKFIAGTTVMVFAALLQSLVTGFLATNGRAPLSDRIDQVSRYLFPVFFAAFCAWHFSAALAPG